jgi:hypothetical protein
MTTQEFEKIMEGDSNLLSVDDDNAFLGLQIIRKYAPKDGIEGADHDIIYSTDVEKLIDAGITKDDAKELRRLNWMIYDDTYMACFVN